MAQYQQRESIRSTLGKKVRITYYHRDLRTNEKSPLDREATYEGILSIQRFEAFSAHSWDGGVYFRGCIDGVDGKKFPIMPLDGPLHHVGNGTLGYDGKYNGYWELEVLEEQ